MLPDFSFELPPCVLESPLERKTGRGPAVLVVLVMVVCLVSRGVGMLKSLGILKISKILIKEVTRSVASTADVPII
jgi:hypothetical protein